MIPAGPSCSVWPDKKYFIARHRKIFQHCFSKIIFVGVNSLQMSLFCFKISRYIQRRNVACGCLWWDSEWKNINFLIFICLLIVWKSVVRSCSGVKCWSGAMINESRVESWQSRHVLCSPLTSLTDIETVLIQQNTANIITTNTWQSFNFNKLKWLRNF